MRHTLALMTLLLGCSGGDDSNEDEARDDPQPTCVVMPSVTQRCSELGYREGRACDPNGRDDGTWPSGCFELENDPGRVDICCP
jgi:hypothetical protein